MISRLSYAILALLARRPSTGYELSARAHRPLGYFWSARHSQIYPELRKLLAQGLVQFTAGPGPGPRAKKVYSVTEAGLAALRGWVIQPPEPTPSRDDLVLKAYAAWTADPAAAGRLFADQIAGHRDRLAAYAADWTRVQSRHHGGPPPVTHPDFGNYATLRCGIDYERQRIGWLEWMSQQFAAHQPDPSGDPDADRPGDPGSSA